MAGGGAGVMENSRWAFEVCHVVRPSGALFGLSAVAYVGNGLCVAEGIDGNRDSHSHLPEGSIL